MNAETQTNTAPETSPPPQMLGDPKKAKSSTPQQIGPKRLALLWGILLFGYFLFVVQWYSITNFQGSVSTGVAGNALGTGWGGSFFVGAVPAIENSATNWMITFGRAIGSILAGYLVAKIGHKYAVVTVLGLMVVAFPFIIVGQNAEWNHLSVLGGGQAGLTGFAESAVKSGDTVVGYTSYTAAGGFALFIIFRTFLAIGGTTLITYTNAIIAKMDVTARPKFLTLNQFGFNGGAFFASIFFVIPGAAAVGAQKEVWTGVLSFFICVSLALMITYLFIGTEMVPPKRKQTQLAQAPNATSFGKVLKEQDTWRIAPLFGIWLIAVVFSTSGTMRGWALPSALGTTPIVYDLSGMNNVNLWNMFTCMFVAGFVVAVFTIARFGRTIFERKLYCHVMFGLGYVFLLCAYMAGRYSYGAAGPIAVMMILSFVSGFFLWGVQPALLTIPQQMAKSTPEYVGIVAGLIWGFGYFFYTCGDMFMNLIATYTQQGSTAGSDGMFIMFWILCALIFVLIPFLPNSGYRNRNGEFITFTQKWNPLKPSHWNMNNKENLIATHTAA